MGVRWWWRKVSRVSGNTEILTAIQTHIVVGEDTNHIKPAYDITTVLTSNRGVTGDAGVSTTVKLADTQISGENKGQYGYSLPNPVVVDVADFIVHEKATIFANNVNSTTGKINKLNAKAKEMPSKNYGEGNGITSEHLYTMLDVHKSMKDTKEQEDDDKDSEVD